MKISAIKLIKIIMGIMIAGLAVLVYGAVSGKGNIFMIRGSVAAIAYAIIILTCWYLYLKAKKLDIELEITSNSINIYRKNENRMAKEITSMEPLCFES